MSLKSFCEMCIEDLIPYYCCNNREFFYYRTPEAKCKLAALKLKEEEFTQISDLLVQHSGRSIHQIDFRFNSCTCRWYNDYMRTFSTSM